MRSHPGDGEQWSLRAALSLLQNWRLEHGSDPGDEAADRIVRQFFTPREGP
jgi:hypothetical protein